MKMKERKFVKLRVDMYDDTKSKIIDTMDERDLIQYIWIRLIVLAGKVNLEGELFLSRNIPYTMETLAIEFNRDIVQVKLAMKVLIDLEMIEFTEDKIYKVKNFVKHQNIKINKNAEIKDNVAKGSDSGIKMEEPKIKARENLISVDSKSNGYKNIDEIVRNKTAKIEDKSIMISKEEINKNNKDDNKNIECIENARTAEDSNNIIYNNNAANKNISLETEKRYLENNVQPSIPISVQKKNSKSRKKSNNKNDISEINLNDDEEIVEFYSGDILLGKDEKVVRAFSV